MENLILENSFASIKQTQLSSEDSRPKFYFVVTGQEEALEFKIVPESLLKGAFHAKFLELKNVKFQKLYCISSDSNLKLEKLVTVLQDADLALCKNKLLAHPSVKQVKKHEPIRDVPVQHKEEKVLNPFDQIKDQKKKKNNLTKESFFASFKKFEKSTDKESLQPEKCVNTKETVDQSDVKQVKENKAVKETKAVKDTKVVKETKAVKENKTVKEKKVVQKKQVQPVSEKSMKQEADLMDMFDKEPEKGEEKEEENAVGHEEGKKIRKKRKVLKTMTFMEGKYMSNLLR